MQRRAVRLTILALLLVLGVGAGAVVWSTQRQQHQLTADRDVADERLNQILTAVAEIGAAQQSYVAPGQSATAAFEQTGSQIQRIQAELEAVRPALRSSQAGELLGVLTRATATLVDADSSVRGHLRSGQTLWAAEVVFGQAGDTRAEITQAVRALQAAESRAAQTEQDALTRTSWLAIGITAAVWALGLVALAWVPGGAAAAVRPAAESADRRFDAVELDYGPSAPTMATPSLTPPESPLLSFVDLGRAAAICTDISRLSSGNAIAGILARTAATLDASGIIVWMAAGDNLYPAAAYGYDDRALARLGAIPRLADNITAAAWRTGAIGYLRGDGDSNGAVVAPMFGPDSCIGVLSAELRNGREGDTDTRAITAVIAAQLATVLGGAPGSSAGTAAGPAGSGSAPKMTQTASLREASGI